MRVTNSMMTSNTMRNVNKSKSNLYTTEEQMSSQKKISKPSDDPIIAIRALSLRTSLTEVTQYLTKNVPDAQAWIKLTETSLDNMNGVFEDMITYCNQGSTDTFETGNRIAIAQTIEQLKNALYAEGNADYSGRYVFTGYRTDRALTFQSAQAAKATYRISQEFTGADFTSAKYMKRAVDITNVADIPNKETPAAESVYRLRLGYPRCSQTQAPTVTVAGTNYPVVTVSQKELEDILSTTGLTDGNAYYVYDKGEVVFSNNTYDAIKNENDIKIEYVKDDFTKEDVRPEHYFDCVDITDPNKPIEYSLGEHQNIEYTINFSQTLKVNTRAKDVLSYDIARDLDDLVDSLTKLADSETKLEKLKEMKGSTVYKNQIDEIESMIVATNKEIDYLKDNMESIFAKEMTRMKGFQNTLNKEIADVGSREVRLTLTKTRLTQQQETFRELKSKNEDVDLEEIAIEFSSAETVHDAAIATAAKTVRQTLLDYL